MELHAIAVIVLIYKQAAVDYIDIPSSLVHNDQFGIKFILKPIGISKWFDPIVVHKHMQGEKKKSGFKHSTVAVATFTQKHRGNDYSTSAFL